MDYGSGAVQIVLIVPLSAPFKGRIYKAYYVSHP